MNNKTWSDIIPEIKERLDIVDVVSQHVILKKKGNIYWGCCPFHNEKTPSFSVTPAKGIYKCFGCGEGGDAINFLMKIKNQSFVDVIKELAEKFNIDLPSSKENTNKSIKKEMFEIMNFATEFFNRNLLEQKTATAKQAFEYLLNRGIDENIIQEFKLGYALNSYSGFIDFASVKYSKELQEKVGLIIKKEEKNEYIDRFRNRIIIPILDENGKTVAFGARALSDEQAPKYLNSPETLIYNKSNILYGLYNAKDNIKKDDFVIIMEGYFDVISTQAAGLKNCVASCGTSLTSNHIKLISRYCNSRKIFLAFDSDAAGKKATQRGGELIRDAFKSLGDIKQFDSTYIPTNNEDKYSCEIRVVTPPEGKDPDEFIRQYGIDEYINYLLNAPLLLDFQINEILNVKKHNLQTQEKLEIVKKLLPLLNEINNNIVRNEYINMVALKLAIDPNALQKEIGQNVTIKNPRRTSVPTRIVKKSSNIAEIAEKNLLSLFMIERNDINFNTLIEMLKEIDFSNEKLIIVNNTIDKIFFQVNNVKELIQTLYTTFAEQEEIKNIITELIDISESFKGLSALDYDSVIFENIKKINDYKEHAIHTQLNTQCKNSDDDEVKALEFQKMLRDKLMNNIKTGDNE